MAKRVIEETTLTSLADAVRELTGETELLTIDEMVQRIRSSNASDIINTAEGDVIYITDCATRKLRGLTLYGKSVQNGTPSPSAPVALNSAGADGNIIVNVDTQTMAVSTPNGLPGILVASDGNYADKNGQQWICDEIDFTRGKYIQRALKVVFDGSEDEGWAASPTSNSETPRMLTSLYKGIIIGNANNGTKSNGICSHYSVISAGSLGTWGCHEGCSVDINGNIHFFDAEYTTAAAWKTFLASNPITCLFQLVTPTETDLTAEELVAYSALHTNYPQTVIYNDADAWMSVKYVVDVATEADYQEALREMGVDV